MKYALFISINGSLITRALSNNLTWLQSIKRGTNEITGLNPYNKENK